MEALVECDFWKNERVLVTGHTGFKGGWLAKWLRMLGAQVSGIALESEQSPGLWSQLGLESEVDHHAIDIRNRESLHAAVLKIQPTVVFHLAAQSLVRRSYQQASETWDTNVAGSIHLMEALRQLSAPVASVMVTSDKVYSNREWGFGYRENDPLGGHDPYSSSKAGAEIAVASWRSSFFQDATQVAIATARAGNVIGGGDWAEDRIIPDLIRSFTAGEALGIRSPESTRPWQHVLEPLAGYMQLAKRMRLAQQTSDESALQTLCAAWNFGPLPESNQCVRELVTEAIEHWPGEWIDQSDPTAVHEANFLGLAIDNSYRQLDWYPRWNFRDCVGKTIQWYRRVNAAESAREVTEEQIREYHAIH